MIRPIEHWRTLDHNGNIMPWYTRPCLEWLLSLSFRGKWIFEYGCGQSSIWYHSQLAVVWGVDDKQEWCLLQPPSKRQLATDGKFRYIERASRTQKPFDIIIIDGLFRDECTEFALKALKIGGYLIADNFEQASADLPDWPKTRELTKHLPLTLYKEPTHPDWQTAVWHNV